MRGADPSEKASMRMRASSDHLPPGCRARNCRYASTEATRPASAQSRSSSDRKSTRLNSSHLVISYAVFCLKKKIQIKRIQKSAIFCVLVRAEHPQGALRSARHGLREEQ